MGVSPQLLSKWSYFSKVGVSLKLEDEAIVGEETSFSHAERVMPTGMELMFDPRISSNLRRWKAL